jgi:hypothetical protein
MPKKPRTGEINKSQAIRDELNKNPAMKAAEVVAALKEKRIEVNTGLVYMVKGHMKGKKGRRKKARQLVDKVTATMDSKGAATTTADVVATIIKVKHLAAEVGGIKKLKALVDALSE